MSLMAVNCFGIHSEKPCKAIIEISLETTINDQRLILLAIESYELMLPKQLGCLICQYAHWITNSSRYKHNELRRKELQQFKELVSQQVYDPQKISDFLDTKIDSYHGKIGTNFYNQCKLILNVQHNESDPQSAPR